MVELLPTLMTDQQQRWRRGERVAVERYLDTHPHLRDSPELLLDLIYHEVVLRERRGETPVLDEYQRRFPELGDDLRRQFEVHVGLGGVRERRKRERLPSVPGYIVSKRIGRGGMGVVFKARQNDLGREVAIKVIRDWATAGPDELVRFRREAEAVARVSHPNVVQIHQVGERKGCPYLVLEYVAGGSLDRRLRGQPLAARPAAELVAVLARAVDHLHRHGIVHCDLKPANVLLAAGDAGGGVNLAPAAEPPARYVPKVADFGFARGPDAEAASRSGRAVGTPQYMAPEQVSGPTRRIGPPADVHALGAILYELLVGRPPFLGDDLLDVLHQVQFLEPVPPRRLQPTAPRDLETICLKCLHKDPARRYPTAAALADDLDRFLAGRPVSARPVSGAERAWRWCRRNPWVAGLAAALLVAVVGGFGAVTAKMLEARQERNDKERARQGEKERADELGAALNDLEAVAHRMRVAAADREVRDLNIAAATRTLDECRPELRSFDWYHLRHLCRGARLTARTGQRFTDRLAVSPDGRLLAVGGGTVVAEHRYSIDQEQTVCIVDAKTGAGLRTLPGGMGGLMPPKGMAFSPDGKYLAVAQADKTLRVWAVETGTPAWARETDQGFFDLAFLSGTELVTAGERTIAPSTPGGQHRAVTEFRVWDGPTGRVIRTVEGAEMTGDYGTLSRDGRRFARWSSTADNLHARVPTPVGVCDTTSGKLTCALAERRSPVQAVALSPDGALLAVADLHLIRVYSTADGHPRAAVGAPSAGGNVFSLAFSPDGRTLVAGGLDRGIRSWDVGTGRETGTYRGHADAVTAVRFLSDGRGLVSSGHDGTVRVWDPAPPGVVTWSESAVVAYGTAVGGRLVAATSPGAGTVQVFDPADPGKRLTVKDRAVTIALSPDGTALATGSPIDYEVLRAGTCGTRLWDASTGRERLFIAGLAGPLAFTPDGRTLIGVRVRHVVRNRFQPDGDIDRNELAAHDPDTGAERFVLSGHARAVRALAPGPDGAQLFSSDGDEVIVWDLATRTIRSRFALAHRWNLAALALRPDGRQLATSGTIDNTVVVRDPVTGHARYVLALTTRATALAFTPDSRLLVAGCEDGTVRTWGAESGQLLLTLSDTRQPIRSLAFTGNGQWLVAGAGECIAWDGRPLAPAAEKPK